MRRLTRAAGRRDWFLATNDEDIDEVIRSGRPHDALTFFFHRQLPLRGTLDQHLSEQILQALNTVVPPADELVAGAIVEGRALFEDFEGFSTHEVADLDGWLERHRGRQVAAGHHPPILARDFAEVLTVIVPDAEGNVEPGVY